MLSVFSSTERGMVVGCHRFMAEFFQIGFRVKQWLLVLLGLICVPVQGVERFVSPVGDDQQDGLSLATAQRTVAKALSLAGPGDVIQLRGSDGVYTERVSIVGFLGTESAPLILQTYPGDPAAVFDFTGIAVPPTDSKEGIIKIENSHHVTMHRVEVRNFKTAGTNAQQFLQIPVGIYINCKPGSSSSHITLSQCSVHGIWQNGTALGDFRANAHGIIVMGRSASAITDLIIDNCDVYDLRLGASEALTLNGNVRDFRVTNNRVHDCNNIGIDFIGHEGVYTGALVPEVSEDQCRYGSCSGNVVSGIDSAANPAYGGNFANSYSSEVARNARRAAAGIYVDGGKHLLMDHNEVTSCNMGIEIASEHFGKTASYCIASHNRISNCHIGGIFLGGGGIGNGGVDQITISHNTLYQNDATGHGGGQVLMNNLVTNTAITNNVVVATGTTSGGTPLYVLKHSKNGSAITVDYNTYAGVPTQGGLPTGYTDFEWNGVYRVTFAAWRTASGQDSHSRFVERLQPWTVDEAAGTSLLRRKPRLLRAMGME